MARLRPQWLTPAQPPSRGAEATGHYPQGTIARCELPSVPLPTRLDAISRCLRRTSPNTGSVVAGPLASIALPSEHTGGSQSAAPGCSSVRRFRASARNRGGRRRRRGATQGRDAEVAAAKCSVTRSGISIIAAPRTGRAPIISPSPYDEACQRGQAQEKDPEHGASAFEWSAQLRICSDRGLLAVRSVAELWWTGNGRRGR